VAARKTQSATRATHATPKHHVVGTLDDQRHDWDGSEIAAIEQVAALTATSS